jgi:predicted secreted protein
MVTKKHDVTIETAIEARPCPSVTARITVTTCVAAVILGVWFFQA